MLLTDLDYISSLYFRYTVKKYKNMDPGAVQEAEDFYIRGKNRIQCDLLTSMVFASTASPSAASGNLQLVYSFLISVTSMADSWKY